MESLNSLLGCNANEYENRRVFYEWLPESMYIPGEVRRIKEKCLEWNSLGYIMEETVKITDYYGDDKLEE